MIRRHGQKAFSIYGPLQVVSCDQWHCFDAVEIRYSQTKKIVVVVHYKTFWYLID